MHAAKTRLVLQFLIYALGDFLAFSALNFTINLQSSINIDGGLGTNALAVTFLSAIFFGLLSTPIVLRKFGPKSGLIASELMMALYIASNYYPAYFTMIPAAVMMGFSEGTIWPSIVLMNVYFGSQYCLREGRGDKSEHYVNLFSGYFFSVHHLNQVLGGLTAFFVLRNVGEDDLSTSTMAVNATSSSKTPKSLEHCGSRDCQMASEIEEAMGNYSPGNKTKLLILISCFMAMICTAMLLHGCFLPKPQDEERINKRKTGVEYSDAAKGEDSEKSNNSEENLANVDDSISKKEDISFISAIINSLKGVGRQFMKLQQLLILPLTFYHGLLTTYILAELPRAFVSCISGYTMISLYCCTFGLGHVSSYLVGRFSKKLGRVFVTIIAATLDTANLLFCLFWNPNVDENWLIFLSYFAFVTHVVYFPEDKEVAGSVWVTFLNLGLAVQFAWSASLCVYSKIYVMLSTLAFGVVAFCIAEYRHGRSGRNVDTHEDENVRFPVLVEKEEILSFQSNNHQQGL